MNGMLSINEMQANVAAYRTYKVWKQQRCLSRLREQNRKVSVRLHEMVLELAGAAARIREITAQNQSFMNTSCG